MTATVTVLDPLLGAEGASAMLRLAEAFGTYRTYSAETTEQNYGDLPQRIDAAANYVRSGGRFGRTGESTSTLADELQARLIPVGVAWHEVANENSPPAFRLYVADHKHPTATGTYLAACVFYRTLYDAPSAGLPNHIVWKEKVLVDLPKQDAAALQKIADEIPLTATK